MLAVSADSYADMATNTLGCVCLATSITHMAVIAGLFSSDVATPIEMVTILSIVHAMFHLIHYAYNYTKCASWKFTAHILTKYHAVGTVGNVALAIWSSATISSVELSKVNTGLLWSHFAMYIVCMFGSMKSS